MAFSITFITNDNKIVAIAEKANLLRTSIREKGGILPQRPASTE